MSVKSEKYWADLLEQYKLGSISKSDRFELEKRALDDPFLFDALEGYSSLSSTSQSEKKEKTKLITMPRMAAAASLVFLVAMTFLLKNNNNTEPSSDKSIAMVLDKKSEESKSTDDQEILTDSENDINSEETTDNLSKNKSPERSNLPNTTPSHTEVISQKKVATNQEVIIKENSPVSNKPESIPSQNSTTDDTSGKNIEEIESDDFIAAATEDEVHIPNDAKSLDTRTPKSQIDSDSSEYQATADNNASIPPAMVKKTKKSKAPSTFYVVEPAIGQKDFEEFVKESIDSRGLRQPSPQEVTIEFDIDKNGELSNFLHIYNGCSECGGYAIYLLSSSGVWKTTPEGQEGRARYSLKF